MACSVLGALDAQGGCLGQRRFQQGVGLGHVQVGVNARFKESPGQCERVPVTLDGVVV